MKIKCDEDTYFRGEYVKRKLDSERDGSVETAQANAESAHEALGKLIEILAEKGLLAAKEIHAIVSEYSWVVPEFVED